MQQEKFKPKKTETTKEDAPNLFKEMTEEAPDYFALMDHLDALDKPSDVIANWVIQEVKTPEELSDLLKMERVKELVTSEEIPLNLDGIDELIDNDGLIRRINEAHSASGQEDVIDISAIEEGVLDKETEKTVFKGSVMNYIIEGEFINYTKRTDRHPHQAKIMAEIIKRKQEEGNTPEEINTFLDSDMDENKHQYIDDIINDLILEFKQVEGRIKESTKILRSKS